MPHIIDLRSDTVTKPTPQMRRAMAEAAVGDDVYGEDPTVNKLEELGATMLGKEAALFVASGTMGNLISVLIHTPRGAEVILGNESHIYHYEQGGASAVGSCVFHPVATQPNGELALEHIKSSIRDRNNAHCAAPGVICLENTHNRCGGAVLSLDYVRQVRDLADHHKLPLHLDGARLANAAVALKIPLRDLAQPFHSVQFDLSKGLGAPVGGLVAGSHDFIKEARRYRKLLGGGMRQAGVIAAAGIVALETMVDRLADDHALAHRLAEGLAEHEQFSVDVASVRTNIVIVGLKAPLTVREFLDQLHNRHILANSPGPGRIRFVTHFDISPADIEEVLKVIASLLKR
jgi:threonine aldolase